MKNELDFLGEVLSQLRSVKHSDLKDVGRGSGVPEGTLRKLYYGEVANPRVQTVQALHDYFAKTGNVSRMTPNQTCSVLPVSKLANKKGICRSVQRQSARDDSSGVTSSTNDKDPD